MPIDKLSKPDKFTVVEISTSMEDIVNEAIREENIKLLMKIQDKLRANKGSYSKALLIKVNNILKEWGVES